MINLKRILLAALLVAVGVSPLIPTVKATDGQWKEPIAEATWNYDLYRVDRLAGAKWASGSFLELAGVTYSLDKTGLTVFQNGSTLFVPEVSQVVFSDDHFFYLIPSKDKQSWVTVYEYDRKAMTVQTRFVVPRKQADVNFSHLLVDGNKIYTSVLHIDAVTKAVKSKLSVYDMSTNDAQEDVAWYLLAPMQEIVDVRDGIILAKFQFDGGFKQLILIDVAGRKAREIPGTWTEPASNIVGAHFLSNGLVQYFQSFRAYSFDTTIANTKPVEYIGTLLNWFVKPEKAFVVEGDRTVFVSPENMLYVMDAQGVSKIGKALDGVFTYENNVASYQSTDGFVTHTFLTGKTKKNHYRVTDTFSDEHIGLDVQGQIWYENTTNSKTLNIGYGSEPQLTDREHALWKGTDGKWYQVTFSPLLDLGQLNVQAVKATDASAVYLMSGDKIWRVPNESVYKTWFDSWSHVIIVSPVTMNLYLQTHTLMGDTGFAPGTRVKSTDNPRVYVVGTDGALHWIVSETVAHSIYGSDWNQGIILMHPQALWAYQMGSNIHSKQEVKTI